jgi:hypothetical protein
MGGFPTHQEVQEAAAKVSPEERKIREFWTRTLDFRNDRRQRTCNRCLQTGHNARMCKVPL